MPMFKTLSRVLLPKSLGLQLGLPWVILLMPVVGGFIWFTVSTLADEQRDAVVKNLVHVGESFRTLPLGFSGKANQDIESFLALAADHHIKRISITDEQGNNIVAAIKPDTGKTYLSEEAQKFAPPAQYTANNIVSVDGTNYWLPFKSVNGTKFWLAINASYQDINQWEHDQLILAFAVFSLVFGVLTPLSVLRVRKTLMIIRKAAEFANSISGNPNSELVAHSDSEEMNTLVAALNRLSKHWHHRLQISEQNAAYLRMHKVAIDLHSAVCITNGNGRIEYVNKHFCIASGYDEKELIGKNISVLNSGYHEDSFFKSMWRTLAIGRVWQGEMCNQNKRGEPYWVKCSIAPIKDQGGRLCQYIAIQTPTAHALDLGKISAMK